jgi:undecaprenyl-phosphate galactose phosphotransferase/putative colanic acid biosynthesis UDP-glucose lipid carrier transferase
VKPGITGWAQVHGLRGETPVLDLMYRRIEADLWYASNCSLSLDIQILFRTIGAVMGQENAFRSYLPLLRHTAPNSKSPDVLSE